jgi:hypothetical protein
MDAMAAAQTLSCALADQLAFADNADARTDAALLARCRSSRAASVKTQCSWMQFKDTKNTAFCFTINQWIFLTGRQTVAASQSFSSFRIPNRTHHGGTAAASDGIGIMCVLVLDKRCTMQFNTR